MNQMFKANDPFMREGKEVMEEESKDSVVPGSYLEDTFPTASEFMNLDVYTGWCSSPMYLADMACPSFVMSPPTGASTPFPPFDVLNISNQYNSGVTSEDAGIPGNSLFIGDKAAFSDLDNQRPFASDSTDANFDFIETNDKSSDANQSTIPRHLKRSLSEKMLTALHLFKEDAGGSVLLQVWVPMKNGDQYILSTSDQPYLLDQTLSGYREVSRLFTFSAEPKPGSFLGLPGRVFASKIPEWTSNLMYYKKAEYLRVQYAADHKVRGSIALPVFDLDSLDNSCCAVLELVTMKEKPNFDSEIENVCRVLQAVNLRSRAPPRFHPQSLSKSQRVALSEIADVLRAVCLAHQLPLALTWIPCNCTEDPGGEVIELCPKEWNSVVNGKLCVEGSACYVNDKTMKGFVHVCLEHYLEKGQGIVGKAMQSNRPFFYPDVKEYHISDYPLVHHARKFGLNAAVAIRLRSTHTGNDDYILELFLPVDMTGSEEQQLLLNNLSSTMQRICRSLRTVSDDELLVMDDSEYNPGPVDENLNYTNRFSETEDDLPHQQGIYGPKKQTEKKRNTGEKNVSLSVLQQYFSGSLKDAAKSIGVCPTTLKRICRQHGIARWPSRKINKVNRSLRKLQSVLDSVQGGLKLDSTTGGFVCSGSFVQDFDFGKSIKLQNSEPFVGDSDSVIQNKKSSTPNLVSKMKEGWCLDGNQAGGECKSSSEDKSAGGYDFKHSWCSDRSDMKWIGTSLQREGSSSGWEVKIASRNPVPLRDSEDIEPKSKKNRDDGLELTSSSMTDSSNASGSRSCSTSRTEMSCDESRIVVKASYRDDAVRFKFDPVSGCAQLYEEIAKRFKLQMGQFQLKYIDDEDEWVLLVTDSDLQECVEILDSQRTRLVKLMVRDAPSNAGSSANSSVDHS